MNDLMVVAVEPEGRSNSCTGTANSDDAVVQQLFSAPQRDFGETVMQRYVQIDGLRGASLIFMLLGHLQLQNGSPLSYIHIGELSFVQSAQIFIFLSGLLVGIVGIKEQEKNGSTAARQKFWRRAGMLYCYELALLLGILAVARVDIMTWWAWAPWLGDLYRDGPAYAVAAAALLYQPTYMDILPQYIAYLLLAPMLLALIARGKVGLVITGSLVAWLAVQLGLHLPLAERIDMLLRPADSDGLLRGAFNPLAWQLVFVSGLVTGALMRRGDLTWLFKGPHATVLLQLSLALLAFFLVWRLAFTFQLVHPEIVARFRMFENRREFSLVFLVNFAALAYLGAWLLVAGRKASSPFVARGAQKFSDALASPVLTLLGRHSLPVFVFHVVVVYTVAAIDWTVGPFGPLASVAIGALAVASLAVPALLCELAATRATPRASASA